ncbi:MAG: hypothetical protein L6V88_00655 [Anaerotruncus sp.]|nr:MAG: hypothetical protein L6V88_00655 [Anaerotruncus sp.]
MGKKTRHCFLVVFVSLVLSTVCSIGASYCLKPILNDVASSIKAGNFASDGVSTLIKNLARLSALYIGASLFTFIQSKNNG